jgi:hypothetical protein
MRPLHKTVKEASLAINDSPWSHLTSNNPSLMGPPSLSSLTLRTQPPRFLARSNMGSTGGPPFPGMINTQIPAASSPFPQPYSAASFASQNSNGYPTPVPATPLSAALGAAAQATIPNTPKFQPLQGNSLSVFERADRLLSNTSRRI